MQFADIPQNTFAEKFLWKPLCNPSCGNYSKQDRNVPLKRTLGTIYSRNWIYSKSCIRLAAHSGDKFCTLRNWEN